MAHAEPCSFPDVAPGSIDLLEIPSVRLGLVTLDHLPAFLALRLDALRQHPEAFVPTWEEERMADPATMAARFRNDWARDGNFVLGAWVHGRLAGAIGVRRWTRRKQHHVATVWLLYTDPAVRGHGIGRSLLQAAITRCRSDARLEILHLSVSRESSTARQLYADAGFRTYGVEPRALRLEDRYVDVELMALDLAEATPRQA